MLRLLALALASSLLAVPAFAQDEDPPPDGETDAEAVAADVEVEPAAEPAPPAPTDEELHDELRAFKDAMQTALNERDIDAIHDAVDANVIFTPMNGQIVRGPEGVRDYYERMLGGPEPFLADIHTTFEADDLSILHDRKTAVAFGHSDGHYELSDGTTFDVEAVWVTTLLRNDEGQWRIASFSYSSSMFDNPILDMQRKYFLMYGGAGLGIAILLAFFVGRRLGKRSS